MSDQGNIIDKEKTVQNIFVVRKNFSPSLDEHKLEFIATLHGVSYVNDSRSISIYETRSSLDNMNAPVILIVKESDETINYYSLTALVREKVKALIYIGKEPERIQRFFSKESILFSVADCINDAVRIAFYYGKDGDVVLFSPTSPNHNCFENYKMMGSEFRKSVAELFIEKTEQLS